MEMKKQLEFVKMLFDNFKQELSTYIVIEEKYHTYCNANYMNKNHGKYALKRKITMLRQELLNLEKMLDE